MNFAKTTVYGWGQNASNQLGILGTDTVLDPAPLKFDHKVKFCCVSSRSSMVVMDDNSVYVFGENNYGELGLGTTVPTVSPRLNAHFPRGIKIARVRAGAHSFFVLTEEGEMLYTGLSGFPTPSYKPIPFSETFLQAAMAVGHPPEDLTGPAPAFVDVAFTVHYGIGLTRNKEVFTWGFYNGKQSQPLLVSFFVGKKTLQVSAACKDTNPRHPFSAQCFFAALTAEGTVHVWSPVATGVFSAVPVPLPSLPRIIGLSSKFVDDGLWMLSESGDVYTCSDKKEVSYLVDTAGKRIASLEASGGKMCFAITAQGRCLQLQRQAKVTPATREIVATEMGCFQQSLVQQVSSYNDHHLVLVHEYNVDVSQSTLSQDLLQLVGNPAFSDFQLRVDNQLVSCHQCILAIRCPSLLMGKKTITDCPISPFIKFLTYVYTDLIDFSDMSTRELVQVASLCRLHNQDRLRWFTHSEIVNQVCADNCAEIADWLHARELREECGDVLRFMSAQQVVGKIQKDRLKKLTQDLILDITRATADVDSINEEYPRRCEVPPVSRFIDDYEALFSVTVNENASEQGDISLIFPGIDEPTSPSDSRPQLIRAHKCILYARCSYFRDRLISESSEVILKGVVARCTYYAMSFFLRSLYYDCTDIPVRHAIYISDFVRAMGMANDRLEIILNYVLYNGLNELNCLDILHASDQLNRGDLKKIALAIAVRSFEQAAFLDCIHTLPARLLVEIIQAKAMAGVY